MKMKTRCLWIHNCWTVPGIMIFIIILFSLLPPNCSSVLFGEARDTSFDVCGSMYHSIIHTEVASKMQQCIKIYYSMFIWNSTCFGRHTTHHQELKTTSSLWFCICERLWTLRLLDAVSVQQPQHPQFWYTVASCWLFLYKLDTSLLANNAFAWNMFCSYSYTCDEFVVNDTQCGLLERVRQDCFHTVSSSDAGDNDCSVVDDDEQESWRSDFLTKEIQENVRTLRPRSRKRYSVDVLSWQALAYLCSYNLFCFDFAHYIS
jgi:hypothetical protein